MALLQTWSKTLVHLFLPSLLFAGGACSSSSSGSSSPACWSEGHWCICGADRPSSAPDFAGTCNASAVGERGICCKSAKRCSCAPVRCGIDSSDGFCMCGIDPYVSRFVGSCTATATTCCTQDTGYCYCEAGCEKRFANRVVSTCELTTPTAACDSGEVEVESCQ